MSETTLYSYYTEQNVTLKEAIANCNSALDNAIGLLYSPQSCQFLKLINHKFQYPNGEEKEIHELNDIFEARIFNLSCELRWLNQNSGSGKAVLLTENNLEQFESFGHPDSINCEAIEQQYILWGKKANSSPKSTNWQRVAEARIGKLDIPLEQEIKKNQRVYLKTWEYISQIDQAYCNFGVIEERLEKLEVKSDP